MTTETHHDTTPLLFRVGEAAQRLNLGRSVLYELIRSRRLRSVKVGRLRLIPASAIEDFIRDLERDGAA